MESETLLRLVIWPAWILLLCSFILLVACFARAFGADFRRWFSSRPKTQAAQEKPTNS